MTITKPSFDGSADPPPARVRGRDGKSYPAKPKPVPYEVIRRLGAQGHSKRHIAELVGCAPATVARVLKGAGEQVNDGGNRHD